MKRKWKAEYSGTSADEPEKAKPALKSDIGKVIYPFTAYGYTELPEQEDVLFRNATVWTNEKDGKLANNVVLVKAGKISRVGKNLSAGGVKVIDATGMHLTSGIIDEHSHIALDATNEGT